MTARIAALGSSLILAASPAAAQTSTENSGWTMPDVAGDLIGLFVVAVILETALTTLFNWRVYREFFNGRAVKTVVMVIFAYAIVTQFGYDIVATILVKAGATGAPGALSKILSALVLAGGSSTAYQMFKAFGLRPPPEPTPAEKQSASDNAWFSVRIDRREAVGGIEIHVEKLETLPDGIPAEPPLAGIVGNRRGALARVRAVLLADPMRFPSSAGQQVKAGTDIYRIVATGHRAEGQDGSLTKFTTQIYVGRFAPRAMIDFHHTI